MTVIPCKKETKDFIQETLLNHKNFRQRKKKYTNTFPRVRE